MKIYNLTYIQFLSLDESTRLELQEVYSCLIPIEVDCELWTWGRVKSAQDLLNGILSYKDILDIAQLECTKLKESSPCHLIFKSFLGVRNSINKITELENNQWSSVLTPKQETALNEVGGFNEFGTIPQTLRLSEILRMSYNEVLNVSWELGFAAYSYDVKSNEYNKLILRA